jgi:membrane protein DedA with SNARE-associated domain
MPYRVILLWAASALIVSILVFLVFGYYESGVPTSANIRIDLLIIIPAMLVNFIIVFVVLLRRKKLDRPKH